VTVETLIDEIIEREKGFVDHPNDKGGPTKWGITKATLQAEARDIYRAKFVSASGFDQLPDMLRSHVVDFGVTTPHYLVVKALQRALNPLPAEGKPDVVVVDGILGAKTLAAVQAREVRALTVRFCQERCRFYSRLAALSPTQLDFMDGWLNRVFGMWPE
jgi:lysozyme family protein